jgi:hypothetical protein
MKRAEIRLQDDEYELMKRKAQARKMTISSYLRFLIRQDPCQGSSSEILFGYKDEVPT